MAIINPVLNDLKIAQEFVYEPCKIEFNNLFLNKEGIPYGSCTYELRDKKIQHRVSKITPTKIGQFVTLWKRNINGKTEPFDCLDKIDFVIISSNFEDQFGQFIFPISILVQNGIISENGKSGKRGFRVYPPWDRPNNKQAEKTQKWQLNYFLNIQTDAATDIAAAKKLLNFI